MPEVHCLLYLNFAGVLLASNRVEWSGNESEFKGNISPIIVHVSLILAQLGSSQISHVVFATLTQTQLTLSSNLNFQTVACKMSRKRSV